MSQIQRTVLIVDDSPEDCEVYRRYLLRDQEYQYTVITAGLGQEGLALSQQPLDIVLLDYLLPDLTGLEFLAQLKAHQHPLPVVIVTGEGNEAIAVQSMKMGAQDYVVKEQITPESLRSTVNGAIEIARLQSQLQAQVRLEQAARAEAETANRVKDEFLAVLSHELRSPLTPILGWSRLLQNNRLNATETAYALATIERNAKLQVELIEDLLDVSRILQGKLSLRLAPVSLPFVISAAVETVQSTAEAKNIQLQLDLDDPIAPTNGDVTRLQQVFWNLLSNAVKFTPNGGQVTVELRQIGQLAQIRVIDTGSGIDPQFLPHVFEYFQQEDGSTTRRFGGLGLGLAIVRRIVELHGGTVKAESQGEAQGATFIVQLPLTQQAMPTASEPAYPQAYTAATLANIQILIVDDDADNREFQVFVLEQTGARITAVASGLEALQALDQFVPDVIITDIGMTEMDGYMLMQQIRSRPPAQGGLLPAIALTAYSTEFDQQKALQAGFQAHITKPVEPETLVRAIVKLLARN